MRTVYKYAVRIDDTWNRVDLPVGARIVHVGSQDRFYVMFWADVAPGAAREARWFRVFGTGHTVWARAEHIGSVQAGELVWHLFEHPGEPT